MHISFMCKMYFTVYSSIVKKYVSKNQVKEIKTEYFRILKNVGNISKKNTILSSYCLCVLFISLVMKTDKTADQWIKIMEDEIRTSSMIKVVIGNIGGYFYEKRMKVKRRRYNKIYGRNYKEDFLANIMTGGYDFRMCYDYTKCGVYKLCKKENCFELAIYLCKLDSLLVEVMYITLKRTTTLAENDPKCDLILYEE